MDFPLLGLFGGTFDPVHKGHLLVVDALLKSLPFVEIHFIPDNHPAHKEEPTAIAKDRVRMIELAIADQPHLKVSTIEVEREGVSYTIDTLKYYRKRFPQHSLCLILATDVFASLDHWKKWREFLKYCHIIIAERPQFLLPNKTWIKELLAEHQTDDKTDLQKLLTGKILFQQPTSSVINSTEIRQYLANNNGRAIPLLPKAVYDYIKERSIYRGDL